MVCTALVFASGAVGSVLVAHPASAAVAHDDQVYAFGSATFQGSTSGFALSRPIVAMATTADGKGYWEVASDGGVFSFNAPFYGALAGWPLAQPVVGMTATPTGLGYWIVTADGSVFPFGDARQFGMMSSVRLNAPIKSLVAGPGGMGYWLYAADGGVFSFGSARFHGSTGSMRLNAPVVGMARDGSGNGYWLGAADGGVFTFGDANFAGSASGLVAVDHHVVQVVGMPDGDGYRMLALKNLPDVGLMGMGATGAAVTDVQNRLLALGFWLPGANGVFDADMQQAIWAFQKANGLPRSGVVDSATQAAFRTASRPQARAASGSMIQIDKSRQILMVVQNGVVQYTF
ncbi:MAG TPA: peptidoglycan-binding domain-containing protein, partial [Acidimicrobiia bacterium]